MRRPVRFCLRAVAFCDNRVPKGGLPGFGNSGKTTDYNQAFVGWPRNVSLYHPPYVLTEAPSSCPSPAEGRRNDVATAATLSLSPRGRGWGEGELPINTSSGWC